MKYIEDLTQEEIREQIKFICRNADITPPINGVEFIALIQLSFGKWQSDLFQNAFLWYVTGRIDVKPSKVMTTLFLSNVVRNYIEINLHVLRQKPKEYIALPPVEIDKTEQEKRAYELVRDAYVEAKKGKNVELYLTSLAAQCKRLELELNDYPEIEEWLLNHRKKQDELMAKKIDQNKYYAYLRSCEKAVNPLILQQAATFANYLNEKYKL